MLFPIVTTPYLYFLSPEVPEETGPAFGTFPE